MCLNRDTSCLSTQPQLIGRRRFKVAGATGGTPSCACLHMSHVQCDCSSSNTQKPWRCLKHRIIMDDTIYNHLNTWHTILYPVPLFLFNYLIVFVQCCSSLHVASLVVQINAMDAVDLLGLLWHTAGENSQASEALQHHLMRPVARLAPRFCYIFRTGQIAATLKEETC